MQQQKRSLVYAYIGEQNKPKDITFPEHIITQNTIKKCSLVSKVCFVAWTMKCICLIKFREDLPMIPTIVRAVWASVMLLCILKNSRLLKIFSILFDDVSILFIYFLSLVYCFFFCFWYVISLFVWWNNSFLVWFLGSVFLYFFSIWFIMGSVLSTNGKNWNFIASLWVSRIRVGWVTNAWQVFTIWTMKPLSTTPCMSNIRLFLHSILSETKFHIILY